MSGKRPVPAGVRQLVALAATLVTVLNATPCVCGTEPERPLTECPRAVATVKVDGELSDAPWQDAPVLAPFVTLHGDSYPEAQTEARLLWDGDRLLIAVKAFEPLMNALKAEKTARDSGVWQDDCIEVFLKPSGATDDYQFIVNTRGAQEDHKNRDLGWNAAWEAASGQFAGGWTVEVAIPFTALGTTAQPGAEWSFNVCRERPARRELSAFANPLGSFHNVAQFARLRFVEKNRLCSRVPMPEEVAGETGALILQARGPSADYRATVITFAEGAEKARQSSPFVCRAGEAHEASLSWKRYGLTASTVFMGLHWRVPQADPIWESDVKDLRDPHNPHVRAFLAFCREVKTIAAALGIELSIYTHDEPAYDPTGQRLEQSRVLNDLVHSVGLKTSEAITTDGVRKLGANLDVPVLSREGLSIGPRQGIEDAPYAWYYFHPLEHPVHDRVQSGLFLWYNRLNGACPYALASLGGWDDWKGSGGYRPERYIYDGQNGPIPTLQLEGYREGVDDYKYLEMIERRCRQLREAGLAVKHGKLLAEAESILDNPPAVFAGDLTQVTRRATAADFQALRTKLQELLVRLEPALQNPKR